MIDKMRRLDSGALTVLIIGLIGMTSLLGVIFRDTKSETTRVVPEYLVTSNNDKDIKVENSYSGVKTEVVITGRSANTYQLAYTSVTTKYPYIVSFNTSEDTMTIYSDDGVVATIGSDNIVMTGDGYDVHSLSTDDLLCLHYVKIYLRTLKS